MAALPMTQCAWLHTDWPGTGLDDFGRLPSTMPGEHACPVLYFTTLPCFSHLLQKHLLWSLLCHYERVELAN